MSPILSTALRVADDVKYVAARARHDFTELRTVMRTLLLGTKHFAGKLPTSDAAENANAFVGEPPP